MYGTSSLLWYKDNRIKKFVFQIIQNRMAAKVHLKELEDKLREILGKPKSEDLPLVSWEKEKQKIILEYPVREPGFVHLMFL